MNRRFKFPLSIILVMAVAITSLSAQTSSNSAREVATIRKQWEINWNAKNLAGLTKLYAQDAVLLTSTGQRIVGRDAIGNYLRQALDSLIGPLSIQSISEEGSSNLAFDSGRFADKVDNIDSSSGIADTGGGSQPRTEGYYLIVLKRHADGSWLIQKQSSTDVQTTTR